jgi:hypothetical protein
VTAVAEPNIDATNPPHTAPGHVAILGGGPIGLDAALACVDRGWSFTVYEAAGAVGANVLAWSHVRLFTPWSMNISPRMQVHLRAAGSAVPGPADHCPTGEEFATQLMFPLAALPELAGRIEADTRVLAIARQGLLKHEEIGSAQRGARPFRLLLARRDGSERVAAADLVLDCTGSYGSSNTLGDGGIPAPGESEVADRIVRRIPDLQAGASDWTGRRILLVGSGKSAQTGARDLAGIVADAPGTSVVWAVRAAEPDWDEVPDDPLTQRQELVEVSERLRAGAVPGFRVRTGVAVEALRRSGGEVAVSLRSDDGGTDEIAVDRILGLTGYVGDTSMYRQLQVHECYATSAPMNLSAALLAAAADGPTDCLTQQSHGVDALRVPEPNFFVLGVKSYGRNNTFLLRVGYEQVDEVVGAYAPAP